MAISRITQASAQAATVNISTPTAGDLILVFAHRDGSTTAPSLAAGYTALANAGANTNSGRIAFKYSDGTETTSGTWTNATSVCVGVYRGVDPYWPIGDLQTGAGASTTMSYTGLTLKAADNTAWVVAVGAHRTATNVGTNAPATLTTETSATDIALFDSNGTTTSFSTATASVSANSGWRTYTVELLVAGAANDSVDTLVQQVSTDAQTFNEASPPSAYTVHLPNPSLSGNAIVLSFIRPSSLTVSSITDNKSNTWPAVTASVTDGGNTVTLATYVLPNATTATQDITITFSGAAGLFKAHVLELYNVPSSSPTAGSTTNASSTLPVVTAGSFTPSQSGCYLYQIAVDSTFTGGGLGATVLLTGIGAGPGWGLLTGDRGGAWAAQHLVQVSAAAINPRLTFAGAGNSTDSAVSIAVAIKQSAGNGTAPSGLRIVGQHSIYSRQDNAKIEVPTFGNLTVGFCDSQNAITSVSDSASNSYTLYQPSGTPQALYAQNATGKSSNVLSFTWTGGNGFIVQFFDIAGAATSAFDQNATGTIGVAQGAGTYHDIPDITPTTSTGIVLARAEMGFGPPTAVNVGKSLTVDYSGKTDAGTDQGSGLIAYFNAPASLIDIAWTTDPFATSGGASSTSGLSASALAFKSASVASTPSLPVFGNQFRPRIFTKQRRLM